MKALSIRQPWAWAIVNGYKPVENRNTDIVGSYRGPVLIHAGAIIEPGDLEPLRHMMARAGHDPDDVPPVGAMPRGGFVGSAEIIGVVRRHDSPFFVGTFGIVLAAAKPMNLVRWSGQLGLFNVDETRLDLARAGALAQGRLL